MSNYLTITKIHARELFDSRGKPTVEVEVTCAGGSTRRAIVPSGASTGQFEAVELRDNDSSRLDGTGVQQAVNNVRGEIAAEIIGMDGDDQQAVDRALCLLDGEPNKSRLGANAILGVSLAVAKASASAKGISDAAQFRHIWQQVCGKENAAVHSTEMSLPLPMVNMISGALHAGGNLDFQDFLILPIGAESYQMALEWIITIYRRLGEQLSANGYEGYLVGDEGGYGPKLRSNEEAVEAILQAIQQAGLQPGTDVAIGLDVASSHFYEAGKYKLSATGNRELEAGEVVELLEKWVTDYPILSIEDGLAEDDWDGWRALTARLGDRVQLIGDDLFVTNQQRLQRGIDEQVANSVLIKVNQIGTLWETLEAMLLARTHGYTTVVSARSGETEDATIADLAVGTAAGQIKIGSIVRSERLAKYNQLLRLEEELGSKANYAGGMVFQHLKY